MERTTTMKTIEFVPTICTNHQAKDAEGKLLLVDGQPVDVAATFEGSITLRLPDFDERYQVLEDMGLQADGSGQVKSVEINVFKTLRRMVEVSKAFYVEVKLKRISDGAEFKSFTDLSVDPDCDGIILEVAKSLRSGFRPGKI